MMVRPIIYFDSRRPCFFDKQFQLSFVAFEARALRSVRASVVHNANYSTITKKRSSHHNRSAMKTTTFIGDRIARFCFATCSPLLTLMATVHILLSLLSLPMHTAAFWLGSSYNHNNKALFNGVNSVFQLNIRWNFSPYSSSFQRISEHTSTQIYTTNHHRKVYSSLQSFGKNMESLNTLPTDCGNQSRLQSALRGNNTFHLSHVCDYLSQIEKSLLSSSSPALDFQNCYAYREGHNNATFFKSVSVTLAKPMMRTLIYGGIHDNVIEDDICPTDANYSNSDSRGGSKTFNSKEQSVSIKVQFDQRLRDVRASIEFQRMYSFVLKSLQPAVLAMDDSERESRIPELLNRIENIRNIVDLEIAGESDERGDVLTIMPSSSPLPTPSIPPKTWSYMFNRLASGINYQGKLEMLVSANFPNLLEEYREAYRKATDREVVERVIFVDLVSATTKEDETWRKRKINAAWKCLDAFYPDTHQSPPQSQEYFLPDNDSNECNDTTTNAIPIRKTAKENSCTQSGNPSQLSGKRCETSCLKYLAELHQDSSTCCDSEGSSKYLRWTILQNVYVNTRRKSSSAASSGSRSNQSNKQQQQQTNQQSPSQNYKPPKQHRNGSGIIWTSCSENNSASRHRLCSEFDAVVLSEQQLNNKKEREGLNNICGEQSDKQKKHTSLQSIWEAKHTISPSTLHDILTKKLGAIEELLDDQSAELEYKDGERVTSMQLFPNELLMTSSSASANSEKHQFSDENNLPTLTFGIYGTELLPPENAADSIRSIAAADVVSSNIHEVVRALECVVAGTSSGNNNDLIMVEVEKESTLKIVRSLKQLVKEKLENEKRVQIVLYLEKEVDFL